MYCKKIKLYVCVVGFKFDNCINISVDSYLVAQKPTFHQYNAHNNVKTDLIHHIESTLNNRNSSCISC